MIYLAVLLILCGLLILITALSVETGKVSLDGEISSRGKNKSAEYCSGVIEPDEVEIIFPGDKDDVIKDNPEEEDIFISFDDETSDFIQTGQDEDEINRELEDADYMQIRQGSAEIPGERRKLDSTGRPAGIEKRDGYTSTRRHEDGAVSAVMFDDRSNIIDYESGVGVIDPTFSKYKSIKRIGKGRIESDYDGVNFYLDEKLYRFDFHKVYDIWSGSNYIALPLKGNSTVKLFIIENSAGFPGKVEANFKEYEKGL
ncbi:MAG TPA: hypothetical protein PLY36_04220 [Spirochaetota bacterium]|nr:hypothetical protein [Spirochaetota bacterium]